MRSARGLGFALLVGLLVAAACTLNPQPLPPEMAAGDDAAPNDGGARGDFASAEAGAPSGDDDAGAEDAGVDAGVSGDDDAGDAGGDAGDDAGS